MLVVNVELSAKASEIFSGSVAVDFSTVATLPFGIVRFVTDFWEEADAGISACPDCSALKPEGVSIFAAGGLT